MKFLLKVIALSLPMTLALYAVAYADDEVVRSEEEIFSFLKEKLPQAHKEYAERKREEPEVFQEEIEDLRDSINYYYELKKRNPQMAERVLEAERLEWESGALAEDLMDAKDEDIKKRGRAKLQKMLETIFDTRLAERQMELNDLRNEILNLEKVIEKRGAAKEKIVNRRLQELLDESDEVMGWW